MKFVVEIFFGYSVLWTLIESVSAFFSEVKPSGIGYYLALVFLSVIVGLSRAYQPRSMSIKVGNSNTFIKISFGDVFLQPGYIAIPANDYFDSEIGLPVSPHSLHGIVINTYFGGHATGFDQLINNDLALCAYEDVPRANGKQKRFQTGATALVSTASHRFLLFAFGATDIVTHKVSVTLPNFMSAIQGLCSKARLVLGGESLAMPLVGSGVSGMGLPAQQLLVLNLLVLMNETRLSHVANEINIVVHPARFDAICLEDVRRLVEC